MFNAGVRIYRLVDVPWVPPAPPANPTHTIQISHGLVDEKGLIYAADPISGGSYIMKYTGPERLD
jgi:hypothetical protein